MLLSFLEGKYQEKKKLFTNELNTTSNFILVLLYQVKNVKISEGENSPVSYKFSMFYKCMVQFNNPNMETRPTIQQKPYQTGCQEK